MGVFVNGLVDSAIDDAVGGSPAAILTAAYGVVGERDEEEEWGRDIELEFAKIAHNEWDKTDTRMREVPKRSKK